MIQTGKRKAMNLQTLSSIGIFLIYAGIIIIFSAIILTSLRGKHGTRETKAGGAIIIGPIPIIFGTDKQTLKTVPVLSIILTALLLALTLATHFLSK
jgi:uncharacterized protein (TIGR00304 family)